MIKNMFTKVQEQFNKDGDKIKKSKLEQEIKVIPKNRIFEPRVMSEMFEIADAIIAGDMAYVNLNKFNKDDIEIFFQFICGVLYTIKGSHQKISENNYLFSPVENIVFK